MRVLSTRDHTTDIFLSDEHSDDNRLLCVSMSRAEEDLLFGALRCFFLRNEEGRPHALFSSILR